MAARCCERRSNAVRRRNKFPVTRYTMGDAAPLGAHGADDQSVGLNMIQPTRISGVRLEPGQDSSLESNRAQAESRRPRCGFAKGSDWGPGLTDEITGLLRTRLRLTVSIVLIAFSLYFLRNLFDPASSVMRGGPWGPL